MKKRALIFCLALGLMLCGCTDVETDQSQAEDTASSAAESQEVQEDSSEAAPEESSEEEAQSQGESSQDESSEEESQPEESSQDESSEEESQPDESSEAPKKDDSSKADTKADSSKPLKAGVWMAKVYPIEGGTRISEYYYEFRKDGTGLRVDQDDGSMLSFEWEYSNDGFSWKLTEDYSIPAKVRTLDDGRLAVDLGNGDQYWTHISDDPLAELEFYPTNTLVELAKAYYNDQDGRGCHYGIGSIGMEDEIVIYLYEEMGDPEPMNILTIDRYTGDGRDWDNAYVDLIG